MLNTTIQWARSQGLLAIVIPMDLRKAYDTVAVELIMAYLAEKGFDPKIVRWLRKWCQGHQRRINIPGAVRIFMVLRGLPQGSKLAPILFNLGIDQLIQRLNALQGLSRHATTPCGTIVNAVLFADDTTPVAVGRTVPEVRNNAQQIVTCLQIWSKEASMSFHADKCFALYYGFDPTEVDPLTLDGQPINWSASARILGLYQQSDVLMSTVAPERLNGVRKKIQNLVRWSNPYMGCPSDVRRICLFQCIPPILFYGTTIFPAVDQVHVLYDELVCAALDIQLNIDDENYQREVARGRRFLGWPTSAEIIATRMKKFKHRLCFSPWQWIRDTGMCVLYNPICAQLPWRRYAESLVGDEPTGEMQCKHPAFKSASPYVATLFCFQALSFEMRELDLRDDHYYCPLCEDHGDNGSEMLQYCQDATVRRICDEFYQEFNIELDSFLLEPELLGHIPSELWPVALQRLDGLYNLRLGANYI